MAQAHTLSGKSDSAVSQIVDRASTEHEWASFFNDDKLRSRLAFKLPDQLRLGLPLSTCLRKDSKQVLYYGSQMFDVWCFRMLPPQVVCLSLFNGRRTLREVAETVAFLSDCNQTAADLKVRRFLASLRYPEESKAFVVVHEPEDQSTKRFNAKDYLLRESRLTTRLDAPVSLMIMPTDKCQTDCVYCYACRRSIAPRDLLSVKRLKELFDEAARLGVVNVNLDGGDLFARPEHMEILEHLIGTGIEPGISTKGYISKEKARDLYRIGLRWLQVGLDAPGEMADHLTRRPGYFERMVETIHNLVDAGIRARTNSIIVRESLQLVPQLVDFLMTLPLSDIKVAPAFRGLFRGGEEMLLTRLEKKWFRTMMKEAEQKYPDGVIFWECSDDIKDWSPEERQKKFDSRPVCSSGRTQIIITPDGKVTTCEQSPQTGEFICGDCTNQSIEEVWNSKELREWFLPPREKFEGTVCYDCESFGPCIYGTGHCWLQVMKMHNSIYGPHPHCPKGPLPRERWQ